MTLMRPEGTVGQLSRLARVLYAVYPYRLNYNTRIDPLCMLECQSAWSRWGT